MPDKPEWTSRIPEILEELEAVPESFVLLSRTDIERLLGVKARRAQQLMEVAGAEKVGKHFVIRRDDFVLYLRSEGGDELIQEEKRRRKQVALTLTKLRNGHLKEPPLFVETDPGSEAMKATVRVAKRGFSELPKGIEISPGCVCVRFESFQEFLEKVKCLCIGIARDQVEFEQRIRREL